MPGTATRKAQVVLPADQYDLLEAYAREQGKAVSSVVRETLEQTLLPRLARRRREAALQWLISQELPVADWEEMEREIERMWEPHEPE